MAFGKKHKIIIYILVIVLAILVGISVFWVERRRQIQIKLENEVRAGRLEREKIEIMEQRKKQLEILELKKEKELNEIIEFDGEYKNIKEKFLKEVDEISNNLSLNLTNIDELKNLTLQRLNAAEEFREKFEKIENIPEPLKDFSYKLEEFLDNDIKIWTLIYQYYSSNNYAYYNVSRMQEIYEEGRTLYLEAENERIRVYKEYGLEVLLED